LPKTRPSAQHAKTSIFENHDRFLMESTVELANHELPLAHLRVASLHAIPKLIRSLGGTPSEVLQPLKITERFLSKEDNALPLSVVGEMLHRAVQATDCEHFGLLAGSHSGTRQLGLPGKLIALCPTVSLALNTLRRYLHLHNRGSIALIHFRDDQAMLGYAVIDGNFPGIQELHDGAIAIGLNIMRDLLGPQWCPTQVHLMRRPPKHPEVYARHFGAPCFFNAVRSELVFPAVTLDLPVQGASPATDAAAAIKQGAGTIEPAHEDWGEHVRRTTLELLLTGNCTRKGVAEAMGISERSLNRKLEKAGTSFLEIADRTRYAASRSLIKETNMTLGNIALMLGYTDPSSFCRAFKRWSGNTPLAWRKMKNTSTLRKG
jgi:AraC-like DNA-binding protein